MARKNRRHVAATVPYADAECATSIPLRNSGKTTIAKYLVRRALELMKADFPDSWQACWEVVVENRSPAEVAAQLGISVGAVNAAKFRVLTRLREELARLTD